MTIDEEIAQLVLARDGLLDITREALDRALEAQEAIEARYTAREAALQRALDAIRPPDDLDESFAVVVGSQEPTFEDVWEVDEWKAGEPLRFRVEDHTL